MNKKSMKRIAAGAAALTTLLPLAAAPAIAATRTLSRMQWASVGGGHYIVQANEFRSTAPFTITTDGNPHFEITLSDLSHGLQAYPMVYQGNQWGLRTRYDPFPLQVSVIRMGEVKTSWATVQTNKGVWAADYDIWYNNTKTGVQNTSGTANLEMMVWLNHHGPVQPAGSRIRQAKHVRIGGRYYNVAHRGHTLSFVLVPARTSISGLDLKPLMTYAVSHGYLSSTWWLYSVEAGFELWRGGTGLATRSYSVCVNGRC